MTTIVIQVGNSDDKLSQERWADFACETEMMLCPYGTFHFRGASDGFAPWQNACFVLETKPGLDIDVIRKELAGIAAEFGQDSIAFTIGTTEFVEARHGD